MSKLFAFFHERHTGNATYRVQSSEILHLVKSMSMDKSVSIIFLLLFFKKMFSFQLAMSTNKELPHDISERIKISLTACLYIVYKPTDKTRLKFWYYPEDITTLTGRRKSIPWYKNNETWRNF